MKTKLLFILFAAFPLFAQTSGKLESIRLYEKDLLFLGESRRGPYFLPDSLIIMDSERVYIDDEIQSKDRYTIDYIDGEIRFDESIPKGAQIRIVYKIAPYNLQKRYLHRPVTRRVFDAPSSVRTARPSPEEETEDFASQLTKSGSITRGVTMGTNRGLKVNSSLNINVSGKVAENVEVVAALTDQTTPIQPEGTTQNLQEIDKVFVQIKAPHLSATMGDYQLNLDGTEFARYSRKLQGAMATAELDRFDVTASGAVSRGKYISMQISGQEGNQGPYPLKGDRGQIDIIVLAGTERVYVDGEQMVRGETNDYVIDYAAAQITFTRKRLITADSRIVVDFQYSDEKFRRNLYSVNSKARLWEDRVKLGVTLLNESDDKDNPLEFPLSEEHLSVLTKAGDDPAQAVIDGAAYVGAGKGYYILDEDSVFTYVGRDSGDYTVSFSDIGFGKGSYDYQGGGIYEYVGENAGRYAPVIVLPTARSHSLLDLDVDVSPVSAIGLKGEIAVSGEDLNTYSSKDDEDNQGTAQNWQMILRPDSIRFLGINFGRIELMGKYRSITDRFRDIDRTTEIEYNRRWDLPESANRGEKVREIAGSYEPWKNWTIGGEYGVIKKGDFFSSDRWQLQSRLNRDELPQYNCRIERIKKDNAADFRRGDWLRQRGRASYELWQIQPSIDYEGEKKEEIWADSAYTGFKFNRYTGGLNFKPSTKIQTGVQLSYRDDDEYVGFHRFRDKSTALTQTAQLQIKQVKSLSASLEYTHRERDYADSTTSSTRTDLAELRMRVSPWKRALTANMDYQISNTATAKKERIYFRVSQGDGNYRFDKNLNEYVNDPLGDYIMRIATTDEFVPVVELKASTNIRMDPSRVWGRFDRKNPQKLPLWKHLSTAISTETSVSIDEKTQEKEVWQIYLLNLSKYRQPDVTIFGNLQVRQDVFLLEHNRNFSVRLRYKSRDEKNNQFLEGGQDRLERERSARMTLRLSDAAGSQHEIISKRTARMFDSKGRQDRDIYGIQFKNDISIRPKTQIEIALESRFSWEEDRFYEEPTRLRAYALVPRFNYSLRGKGRIHGELEWSNVKSTPADRLIPYEMADGRSLGNSMRWDIRFDYQISQTLKATFAYSGRNEPERDRTIHTGRAQVTAAFR